MYTLWSLANETLVRLGDSRARIWGRAEVERDIIDGYNLLCYLSRPIWDVVIFNDQPKPSSYDFDWELAYAQKPISTISNRSGAQNQLPGYQEFVASGPASYDFDWERQFLPKAGKGPSNFDFDWERQFLPSGSGVPPAVSELPETLQQVERVAWDGRAVPAMSSLGFEWGLDQNYETTRGQVEAYTMNKDGYRSFRRFRIPSGDGDYYAYLGRWGTFRALIAVGSTAVAPSMRLHRFARMIGPNTIYPSDSFITISPAGFGFTQATIVKTAALTNLASLAGAAVLGGQEGVVRSIPGFHPSGGTRGIIRRIHLNTRNTRVEIQRRGQDLRTHSHFEIPDIYVRYTRHYVMMKAYKRIGAGQNLRMAKMYEQRWTRGIARLKKRIASLQNMQIHTIGQGPRLTENGRPPLARLPWPFPERSGRRRRQW